MLTRPRLAEKIFRNFSLKLVVRSKELCPGGFVPRRRLQRVAPPLLRHCSAIALLGEEVLHISLPGQGCPAPSDGKNKPLSFKSLPPRSVQKANSIKIAQVLRSALRIKVLISHGGAHTCRAAYAYPSATLCGSFGTPATVLTVTRVRAVSPSDRGPLRVELCLLVFSSLTSAP